MKFSSNNPTDSQTHKKYLHTIYLVYLSFFLLYLDISELHILFCGFILAFIHLFIFASQKYFRQVGCSAFNKLFFLAHH